MKLLNVPQYFTHGRCMVGCKDMGQPCGANGIYVIISSVHLRMNLLQ